MRRRLLILGTTLGAVAIATAVTTALLIAAGWTDTQSTSGNVTISGTTPDLLYICDLTGGVFGSTTECPGTDSSDDTGADEIIYEDLDEALLPGGPAAVWDIRLRNPDPDVAWDVIAVGPAFTPTADPGGGCGLEPDLTIRTVALTGDNHVFGHDNADPGYPALRSEDIDNAHSPLRPHQVTVHVAQSGFEDVRFRVSIPGSFPIECQGNAWDLDVVFTVEVH